jgi:hypothetical protein
MCLTTTWWSWKHKTRKLFCRLLEKRTTRAFSTVPQSSILNPEVPRGGNLLFLQHFALGVLTSWHIFLVSSRLLSGTVSGEQRKTFTTAIFIE